MSRPYIKILSLFVLIPLFPVANAKTSLKTYSFLWKAHAANAGGQDIYSIRRADDDHEISLFRNEYLISSGRPLMGATYSLRLPVCDSSCFVQGYTQLGAGLSTAGPLLDITWSVIGLWVARVDFTTQLFLTKTRIMTWSVPLWIGVSLPLPW